MKNIAALSRFVALFAVPGAVLSVVSLRAAARPNVVVILTDDQGWGDLSANGNTNLSTPNIDSLAKDGASFDRFYVCPVCSPTRAEFLTGRYHPRSGVYSTSAGGERMDLDEMTIADTFKAAGYATAAFGKWHNGMQYPYHPNGRGFDEYYVEDFKSMKMGTIHLKKGIGELTLRALKMSGSQVMEFRLMMLTRVGL